MVSADTSCYYIVELVIAFLNPVIGFCVFISLSLDSHSVSCFIFFDIGFVYFALNGSREHGLGDGKGHWAHNYQVR